MSRSRSISPRANSKDLNDPHEIQIEPSSPGNSTSDDVENEKELEMKGGPLTPTPGRIFFDENVFDPSNKRRPSGYTNIKVPPQGSRRSSLSHFSRHHRDSDDELVVEADPEQEPITWWFAGKGIPLIAATLGPLANLTSLCAIICTWEQIGLDTNMGRAVGIKDPAWELGINAGSLVLGFVGNILLMFNYAQRVSYRVAMPMTILMWYLASGLLLGILLATHYHNPPNHVHDPLAVYSQGFWYGVISACLYLIAASLLFINILGFLKGHYPAHVESSKNERSLMLQTILFFAWLAGGAGVFAKVEDWNYANAMYFCNVTLLTVGFGDLYATTDTGRGLVFPFSVGGIVMLGLVVNSIHGLIVELGQKDMMNARMERIRADIQQRAVRLSVDLTADESLPEPGHLKHVNSMTHLTRSMTRLVVRKRRPTSRQILLRASRDRFEAMRLIQANTLRYKRYTALFTSTIAFFLLWLLGAVVFMVAEKETQGLSYFQALYFCYVSLLTIGYGDLSPKSNAGKSFFLIWSLLSVPSITILISSMGSTVIARFQDITLKVAEFTILPKAGLRAALLKSYRVRVYGEETEKEIHEREIREAQERVRQRHLEENRLEAHGNITRQLSRQISQRKELSTNAPSTDNLSTLSRRPLPHNYTFTFLLQELTLEIRRVGTQVRKDPKKLYNYHEWVEFTRLIRACEEVKPRKIKGEKPSEWDERIDDDEGFVLWDWIGQDSPLINEGSEPEWILERLCAGLQHVVQFHERRGSDARTIREVVEAEQWQ